jgi:WD40 repeat protein
MRGITAISNSVCVGLSTGGINIFKFSQFEQLSNGHTSMQTLDPAFQNPITALSSSRSMMCAGNENGDISVYEMDNKNDFTVLCTFHGKSSPLTCLCCQKDNNTIFAGFLSGHIRIYRPNIAEMTIEITAHVRSITGIILDPLNKFYATCGEDQFFQVWNIPDFSDENYVRDLKNDVLFFSELIENRLCTGLAFLPDNKIAVASYDDESLVVFQQQI